MGHIVDHDHSAPHREILHGQRPAATHEAAMDLLEHFGLTIHVGAEIRHSADHQTALLTLVNVARRTLLAGIEVTGLTDDAPCISTLAPGRPLAAAVRALGGRVVAEARRIWPSAVIGNADIRHIAAPCWRVTWAGWRGGVIPARHRGPLPESRHDCAGSRCWPPPFAPPRPLPITPATTPWPGAARPDFPSGVPAPTGSRPTQPNRRLHILPSQLWLIGLGNLGQAFAWLLACLPYADRAQVELLLHDFDRLAPSNDSTSLLSFLPRCRAAQDKGCSRLA